MQFFLVFAVVMLILAAVAPRFLTPLAPKEAPPMVVAKAVPQAAGARTVAIRRGENGFATDAIIDGRRLAFLVDTGASVIVLRQGDAARLGVYPLPREYTARVSTANGSILAAPIKLDRVEVGDLLVRNVAAVVLPDAALAQNLLGMSFLSQVHWQYQGGTLMLEQ